MKFIPILFSTPMVQAILEGRKTMTRRIVKGLPDNASDDLVQIMVSGYHNTQGHVRCPYGHLGDVLWVRESWNITTLLQSTNKKDIPGTKTTRYKADDDQFNRCTKGSMKWKPSIHMSKEACRLFLKIKSVKVERLQDISEQDAIAEGVQLHFRGIANFIYRTSDILRPYRDCFSDLWASINGHESWVDNPWVWVIEFERIEKPENFK